MVLLVRRIALPHLEELKVGSCRMFDEAFEEGAVEARRIDLSSHIEDGRNVYWVVSSMDLRAMIACARVWGQLLSHAIGMAWNKR